MAFASDLRCYRLCSVSAALCTGGREISIPPCISHVLSFPAQSLHICFLSKSPSPWMSLGASSGQAQTVVRNVFRLSRPLEASKSAAGSSPKTYMSVREDVIGSRLKLQLPLHKLTQRQADREIHLGGRLRRKIFAANSVTAKRCPDPTKGLAIHARPCPSSRLT